MKRYSSFAKSYSCQLMRTNAWLTLTRQVELLPVGTLSGPQLDEAG